MRVPVVNRRGQPIESLEDWRSLASPGPGRWAEHYSAHAAAGAWLDGSTAGGLIDLLRSSQGSAFDAIQLKRAIAEAQTSFDRFGGPRNHDLLIEGSDARGAVVIGIEAKVNEPFDRTLAEYLRGAQLKRSKGESTNAPVRLKSLTKAIAGTTPDRNPDLLPLRFQLFSAVAGVLAAAEDAGANRCVLVVHELATAVADATAQGQNRADLAAFASTVFGLTPPQANDWLVGPVRIVQSTEHFSAEADLWLGHLVATPAPTAATDRPR